MILKEKKRAVQWKAALEATKDDELEGRHDCSGHGAPTRSQKSLYQELWWYAPKAYRLAHDKMGTYAREMVMFLLRPADCKINQRKYEL